MAVSLSFCGVGTVRNLDATNISFSTKTSLTCKKNNIVTSNQGFKTGATASEIGATEPITKEDLISYFAAGCKPKEMWRIGTEYETFGFDVKTLCPMNFEQVTALLSGVSERFYWDKEMENGRIIGLKQGMKGISLEAGCQVELSGAPLKTLHESFDELRSHLHQVKTIGQEMGIKFIGIGYEPKSSLGMTVAKQRYKTSIDYLAKFGSSGEEMLSTTCTVQVNLDYSSETDMIRKFRASLALQPIAAALFANSPFSSGKPSGFLSKRSNVWLTVPKNRTGMIPFVFEDSFGFERYAEYALDVPMLFLYRNKRYLDCRGITFRDFFFGKNSHLSDEQPTICDWENHLGTIWPEVRLKKFLEMRGADTGSRTMMNALPALWVGLLYDEESLQSVLDMIDDWTTEEREMLRTQVPITGLKTMFRNAPLKHVAEDIIKIAKGGLERRRYQEAGFLNAVAEVARTGVTPAEELLKLYNGAWGQCIDRVYEELQY